MARPIVYLTDASVDQRRGWAGIAVVRRDRDMELVAADVVRAQSSTQAEQIAIRRASEIAALCHRNGNRIEIWTDCDVGGRVELVRGSHRVKTRDRSEVRPAHIAARQVLKAHEAGRHSEGTYEQMPSPNSREGG